MGILTRLSQRTGSLRRVRGRAVAFSRLCACGFRCLRRRHRRGRRARGPSRPAAIDRGRRTRLRIIAAVEIAAVRTVVCGRRVGACACLYPPSLPAVRLGALWCPRRPSAGYGLWMRITIVGPIMRFARICIRYTTTLFFIARGGHVGLWVHNIKESRVVGGGSLILICIACIRAS